MTQVINMLLLMIPDPVWKPSTTPTHRRRRADVHDEAHALRRPGRVSRPSQRCWDNMAQLYSPTELKRSLS